MGRKSLQCVLTVLVLAVLAGVSCAATTRAVWIEAENHESCNFEGFEVSSMGRERMLSGGQWIMKGVSEGEVEKIVPTEGVRLTYQFEAPAGRYDFWARIGWFTARAPFRWRINQGEWSDVPSDYPTRNLMELGFFLEASWADLGAVDLKDGDNTLEIVYPRAEGGKSRMLMALDCFAFVQGAFTPEGSLRPGESYDEPTDRQAAAKVYKLPAAKGVERTKVELTGLWQVARYDDPDMDADTYEPVKSLPTEDMYPLRWMAFETPGNPWDKPPLVFGHRLIYRTRVQVPESHAGRGFKLHFSGTNWIVSVFINGDLAGTHRGVWVPWDLDVSEHIRPGEVNEIAVAVKGTYYAMDKTALGGESLMQMRNRPLSRKEWSRWVAPIYPSTKGDGDGYIYGIVNPVTLVSTGDAYVEDVFVKPSVERKRLDTDVTIRNTTGGRQTLEVLCEAVNEADGKVERTFDKRQIAIDPAATALVRVGGAWENPKLWWPEPNPHLYRLRTTLLRDGEPVDIHEQLFGFREVTIRGTGVYINGVRRNLWNWVDVHAQLIEEPEDWTEAFRQEGNRFMRFSHGRRIRQALPTREQRLEYYDRAGVAGRLCTMIDGMFISFKLGDGRREGNQSIFERNEPVWENFREHMAQVAKAYRNHPSVILYQVENELVYINGMNLYGSHLDQIEEWMNEVVEAGRRQDPTRPCTVGGGGDLGGRLEINSPHYPHTAFDYYPGNAYTVDQYATKIERWPWDRTKPWIVGESCFANELEFGAYVAGDEVFRGIDYAKQGKAKWLRMLYGGYRWAGVAGFFPWDNLWNYEDAAKIFSDLYAVPRKQSWRLYAGCENRLLYKIMNDTLHSEKVNVEWRYRAGGRRIAGGEEELTITRGEGREYPIIIPAPPTGERLDGTLTIRLTQPGTPDYADEVSVPILPVVDKVKAISKVYLLDRQGATREWLDSAKVEFESIYSLEALADKGGLCIIGHDTLTPQEAYGTGLLAFAARGGRIVCLEQQTPPSGSALPAPIRATSRFGGYAHPQALGTPLFRDLGKDDLIDWAGDHPTYKNVYQKPAQGARSLAECGGELEYSPLIETPCGKGVIILCQMRIAEKLGLDPAADILLRNLIETYGAYTPASGRVAVFAPKNALLAEKVLATGVLAEAVDKLSAALDASHFAVVLVKASSENLKRLLDLEERVRTYQRAGGWLMLCGLEPDGLRAFNRLTGGDHMIRPFRIERVTLENPQYPLAATLGNRDMALLSAEGLMHGRYWVSGNTFSHVIDGRDFAPFTQPPGASDDPFEYMPTKDDHDPYNFVNGMLSSDSWKYIRQIWVNEDGADPLVFRLRRPDTLAGLRIWNNEFYWTTDELDVIVDGRADEAIRLQLPDSADLTEVMLPEPVHVKKTITLQIRSWRERPISRTDVRLVGIDNVQFLRPKAPEDAVFLDNVGGLVAFPQGEGGVFLNQLKWMAEEPRPENADKKLRLLGVLLQNMGAGFQSASAVAVPGLNVRYEPVSIQEYCNAYRDRKRGGEAWFDKDMDLSQLGRGRMDLADVTYHLVDYATAPIPDCIILGGERARWNPAPIRDLADRVDRIPVGRKADVLYFLHTAHVGGPVTDRERQQMNDRKRPFELPTVMQYVLHYADGQTAAIDVVLERHIDHWLREEASPLPQARIGWSRPSGDGGKRAVLYSMQAANPRPDVPIRSIDIVRTSERAAPAVLAISTGTIMDRPK